MSSRGSLEKPTDPLIRDSNQPHDVASLLRILDEIKLGTDSIDNRAAEYQRPLAEGARWIWTEIKSLQPADLLAIWNQVENYTRLIRDVRLAINNNTMSRERAGVFCLYMRVFTEKLMKYRGVNASRPDQSSSFIQNVNNMNISGGHFASHMSG